jgi:hypothetical protein
MWPFGDKVSDKSLSDLITGAQPSSDQGEFNVNPPETPQETFPVDTTPVSVAPPSSPETLDNRSYKIKYGLGDILNKTKDEIYADLANGNEPTLREQAAGEIDRRKTDALESVIKQATANKGAPLTPEEASGLSEIVKNLSSTTDPQTVFEEAYGKQFISELDKAATRVPDNVLDEAKQLNPEEVSKVMIANSSLVAKRERILSKLQDAQDEVKDQGYLGWGYDQAKMMVPGYHDIQLRGNVEGVPIFSGGFLGENEEKQRQALLRLPLSDMDKELDRILEGMNSNPSLKVEFLHAMLGNKERDIMFSNITTGIDVAGLGVGKAALKAGKGIAGKLVGKDAQVIADTETAARQMAQASADPKVSKSTMEASAGDLQESAVTRAVTNGVEDARGIPDVTKRGIDALTSAHKVDFENIKANPGTRGQDIVNRIGEMYDQVGPILQKAKDIGKVERLPEIMSNDVYVRSIVDKMKDTYVGMRNTLLDVSKPYRENLAGNWYIDFYLGHPDGTYFTNRSTAENFIKEMGYKDATVKEGQNPLRKSKTETYYIPESSVKTVSGKANPNFGYEIKEGKPTFFSDITNRVEVQHSTKPDVGLVPVEVKGQNASFGNPIVSVDQQGLGYFIKVTKPINETDDAVRDVIASSKNTQIPIKGLSATLNSFKLGKFRTPEDTLSKADRANRLIATYNPNELVEILSKNSPNINRLATAKPARFSKGRQKWDEFVRVIENGQDLWDVDSKTKGYFFNSPEDLENAYMSWFKRLPDDDEVLAYFEFKRNMEIDRGFRNMAEHRNQTRVGAQSQTILTNKGDEVMPSPTFSGVARNKLSGSKDNIAIIGRDYGNEKILNLGKMATSDKNDWNKLIQDGTYRLIEVYNPELRELNGYGAIGDQRIRFVLARNVDSKELTWDHIPRRGGGHVEYDYPYALKQAKIKKDDISGDNWYEGDTTVLMGRSFKSMTDYAKKLDHVRKLLRAENETAAKDYTQRMLHIPWTQVKGWFRGELKEDGTYAPGRLSLNEKIQVVPKGDSIVNMSDELEKRTPNFRNGTKEGSLARQTRVEFSQLRDADEVFALDNKGTADNPLYNIVPAEKVDPITTMNRGLNSIMKSNFMDDYKTMAVEHWLQQAKSSLSATEAEIRHSPFYYFHEAKFRPDADPILKGQLETAKAHILQLVGQPSDTANKLQRISQKLADAGEKIGGPNSVLANEWDLSRISDPFAFARSVAYHVKMGLANIPSFIVQMGNYTNILGIAGPKYAISGTYAAQLHFWSTVNSHPNIINYLDKMATKLHFPGVSNYKPGEFKEALEEFQKTGFGNVKGEYAALDDPMNAKLVTQGKDTFLDMSSYFVRNGERNSRYGAWYTAMKEFRDKKPFGRITDQDRADILQRADMLNINMSRASSSALHTGAMSIPAQFLTYQIRLFELFMGNRLTSAEKARMFFVNSLMYGIPMGIGLTGIPAADYFRQKMMERGYNVGENFWKSFVMEGLPSAIGAIITGKGDPQAGTWYDINSRLGSRGLEFLGGVNKADKSTLDVLGGPAYSIAKGTIEQSYGFWNVMTNLYRRDGELFPPTAEDFTDLLKEITSVNSAFRTLAALQTGRWISKKEAWLADATPTQAIISALTSFKDQNINDIQTIRAAASSQKAYEKQIEDMFLREYRRGVVALKGGDGEQSKKFFTRASILLHRYGYPEDKLSSLLSRASDENQSILDKVEFNYYTRQTDRQLGMDSLIQRQKIKAKQRGED